MDIDLETCILAFLIGFALYLLVNRVFMVEGMDSNEILNNQGCQTACNTSMPGQGLTCEWVDNCSDVDGGKGCNIGGIHPNCRACGGDGYSSCLSPPLNNDEKTELKGFFENATYDVYERDTPTIRWEYTEIIFTFDNMKQLRRFLELLDRNTDNSLVSLPRGYPPILFGPIWMVGGKNDPPDVNYMFKVANCFEDDIIGIYNEECWGSLTKGSLSLLPNLKYLDLSFSTVSGKLSDLSGLTNLKFLELSGTHFSGKLSDLSGLTNLEFLDLGETGVSGKLSDINGLTNLKLLDLGETGVSGKLSDINGLIAIRYTRLCPNANISGDVSDVPAIKTIYQIGNTDLYKCDNVTGVIQDINCSDERYNCTNCDTPP